MMVECMSDRGQVFTLDVSIASLFLLSISLSIIWLSNYSFEEQSRSIENIELVTYGKITHAEIIDRLYLEEAVVSLDNFEFDGADVLRRLGINNSYSYHVEVRDIDDNVLKSNGINPPVVTDVFALTAPVLIQEDEGYTHGILYYRFWRRTSEIERGNITVITLGSNNTRFSDILVNLSTADGSVKFFQRITNESGETIFKNLLPGEYIINASLGIFHWEVEEIEVEAGKTTTITIDTKLTRR
jgi:hypothetical protein